MPRQGSIKMNRKANQLFYSVSTARAEGISQDSNMKSDTFAKTERAYSSAMTKGQADGEVIV